MRTMVKHARWSLVVAAAGLLAAAPQAALRAQTPTPQPSGTVAGVVRATADAGATPLPYAMVELVYDIDRAEAHRTVLADSAGRYVLRDVPPGMRTVRALHVGHAVGSVDVLVPAGATVEVDLQLARQPVELAALRVLAPPLHLPDVDPRTLEPTTPAWAANEIALRSLAEGTGMAEAGVGRSAGGGDGGNDPADPRDVLLMRGSTADLKLVLLDGAPVYTPFHLGGLLPSFDATTMGGAALHVGGAPARYDGGLSYILDLRTRTPRADRLHGGASVDVVSAQASLEGPLGAHAGVLAAGRALHDGAALWGRGGSPYGYRDGLVRFSAQPSETDRLSLTAFANRESVFLDLPTTVGLAGPDAARWGNDALSLGWQTAWGETRLDATGALSRYEAELPVPATAKEQAAGRTAPSLATGRTDRQRATLDASKPLARGGTLRFGASADRIEANYGARRLDIPDEHTQDVTTSGTVAGGYVDVSKPATATVNVRLGLRADRFSSDGRLRWAPRAAVSWSLADDAMLTLAAGRYHQYTRASDATMDDAVDRLSRASTLPPDVAIAGTGSDDPPEARALLPVATADHLVLSLDQQLEPRTRLGIQGFLKGFTGLDGTSSTTTSSGLDLRLVREGENLTGWLGYSLAWFWSADGSISSFGSTSRFSGRHLLSAGLTGHVQGPFGVDLRVAFSDGLPYTAVQMDAAAEAPGFTPPPKRPTVDSGSFGSDTPALAGGPTDSFLRLDAELYAYIRPGLRPYVKLLNALDRRDALFWYFAPWRDPSVRPLATLSLLPVVGLEWRF